MESQRQSSLAILMLMLMDTSDVSSSTTANTSRRLNIISLVARFVRCRLGSFSARWGGTAFGHRAIHSVCSATVAIPTAAVNILAATRVFSDRPSQSAFRSKRNGGRSMTKKTA